MLQAKNVVALGKRIVEGMFQRIPNYYSDDLQQIISTMLNVKAFHRPSVDKLMQHPRLKEYLAEGKLLVREYRMTEKFHFKYGELCKREERIASLERAFYSKREVCGFCTLSIKS